MFGALSRLGGILLQDPPKSSFSPSNCPRFGGSVWALFGSFGGTSPGGVKYPSGSEKTPQIRGMSQTAQTIEVWVENLRKPGGPQPESPQNGPNLIQSVFDIERSQTGKSGYPGKPGLESTFGGPRKTPVFRPKSALRTAIQGVQI